MSSAEPRAPAPNPEGAGDTAGAEPPRLVEIEADGTVAERGGSFVQVGAASGAWRDPYHLLLTLSWPRFFAAAFLLAVAANAAFAALYLALGGIENARPGSFADAFFFSVQTMSTVGYGHMHPVSPAANAVASLEAMLGMTGFALGAALLFARVSRPTARVLFSRVAVVSTYEGGRALMFRCANQRTNQMLEACMLVTLVRNEPLAGGGEMRRFHPLTLVQEKTPIFALPWTVIHVLDEASPLGGESAESLSAAGAEIVVVLSGIDDVFARPVHARHSYVAADLRWDGRFADIVAKRPDGKLRVDLGRIHDVEAEPAPPRAR